MERRRLYSKIIIRKKPKYNISDFFWEAQEIYKQLEEKGLSGRIPRIVKGIKSMDRRHEKGISYIKIKSKLGKRIKEDDFRMILDYLKRLGEIFEPKKDIFKAI